ncbi:MAG TPA: hypothetical protein VK816_02520 [Jatrophihabitantaceae bacterium]|nr:hypothetical protein [Jatrophihabitantaceae bacterium]
MKNPIRYLAAMVAAAVAAISFSVLSGTWGGTANATEASNPRLSSATVWADVTAELPGVVHGDPNTVVEGSAEWAAIWDSGTNTTVAAGATDALGRKLQNHSYDEHLHTLSPAITSVHHADGYQTLDQSGQIRLYDRAGNPINAEGNYIAGPRLQMSGQPAAFNDGGDHFDVETIDSAGSAHFYTQVNGEQIEVTATGTQLYRVADGSLYSCFCHKDAHFKQFIDPRNGQQLYFNAMGQMMDFSHNIVPDHTTSDLRGPHRNTVDRSLQPYTYQRPSAVNYLAVVQKDEDGANTYCSLLGDPINATGDKVAGPRCSFGPAS